MSEIAVAAGIMGGLGLAFGLMLAVAYRLLHVEEDPRLDQLESMLPGSNCGACGSPGCRAFAESVLAGTNPPAGCTVASPDAIEGIADYLGVDAGEAVSRVARLHCAGGASRARQLAAYEGVDSCRTAHLVGGGGKACTWGCLGLADCEVACDFDAITMNADRLPVVNLDTCTACGDCVEACPRDLFELVPVDRALFVQCAVPLAGDAARALCDVACDGCGKCAQDAAPGLITMRDDLPVVDYSAGGPARPDAVARCPTGAIVWLTGPQFQGSDLVQIRVKRNA